MSQPAVGRLGLAGETIIAALARSRLAVHRVICLSSSLRSSCSHRPGSGRC
jgi:hypothetical protein